MRLGQWILAAAITLVLAAIVHLGTVLALPHTAPRDAWSRLADIVSDDEVTVLPAARPGNEILPMLDPNLVYGVCRYDVTDGPVGISAEMPPAYWSISLQSPQGTVFYAIDDEAAIDGTLEIEMRNPEAMRRYQLAKVDDSDRVIAVEAPTMTGFVLMRALVSRGADRGTIETMMRDTFCGPIEETVVPEVAPQDEAPEGPRLPLPPQRPEGLD